MVIVECIMVVMAVTVLVVLVEVVVLVLVWVVYMVVEVVLQITPLKEALVELVPLGLFGALEEHFQIPLLMINNI